MPPTPHPLPHRHPSPQTPHPTTTIHHLHTHYHPCCRRVLCRERPSPPTGLDALQQLTRLELRGGWVRIELPLGLLCTLGARLAELECHGCCLVQGPAGSGSAARACAVQAAADPPRQQQPLLPRLAALRLVWCDLGKAPQLLAHTPQLRCLAMVRCGLHALPPGLGALALLRRLELWDNFFNCEAGRWRAQPPPRLPPLPALREVHWEDPEGSDDEGSYWGQEEDLEGVWGEAEYRESGGAAWAYF